MKFRRLETLESNWTTSAGLVGRLRDGPVTRFRGQRSLAAWELMGVGAQTITLPLRTLQETSQNDQSTIHMDLSCDKEAMWSIEMKLQLLVQ